MRRRVMLIVETSLAYGRGVLDGITQYLVAHEPWSIFLDLRELIVEPPEWLNHWDGDGVISRSTTPEFAEMLLRRGLPAVDLTDVHGDLGLPHIWTDQHAVGRMAASHLHARGFRRFAFCGFSDHDWSIRRREGFRHALREQGIDCAVLESPWHSAASRDWESRQQEIGGWLAALPKPVGVLACNDMRGQHLLDACRRREISVPEEVAVLGVDNDELVCQLCDPPLSSIVLNPRRIGYLAAALLDRLMGGRPPSAWETLVEPLEVITRQSTDVLAIDDPQTAAAVKYIREHACRGLTVEEVRGLVGLSRGALERRFRKYLGRSPQAEIRQVQLKRVRQLLLETDLSMERIAALAGFEHPEYLSVVFKRETGQTPGAFRRRPRE